MEAKGPGIIYDRENSSFSELMPGMLDWEKIFDGAGWFHFSAISVALGDNVTAVCNEAIEAASLRGMGISVDLNYRELLWQTGRNPLEVMPFLVQYCDVIMGNIWSSNKLLGIELDADLLFRKSKKDFFRPFQTAEKIMKQFPNCGTVANTFRFDVGKVVHYYAALNQGTKKYLSPDFFISKTVNRVGSGDCFMTGLLHGILSKLEPQELVAFAASAAAGKLEEAGDHTNQTVESITKRLKSVNSN